MVFQRWYIQRHDETSYPGPTMRPFNPPSPVVEDNDATSPCFVEVAENTVEQQIEEQLDETIEDILESSFHSRRLWHVMRCKPRFGVRGDWNTYVTAHQRRHADSDVVPETWARRWDDRMLGETASMRCRMVDILDTIEEIDEESVYHADVVASGNVSPDPVAPQSLMCSGDKTDGKVDDEVASFNTFPSWLDGIISYGGEWYFETPEGILEGSLELRSGWHKDAQYLYFLEDSLKQRSTWHEQPSDEMKFLQFLEDSVDQRSAWHGEPSQEMIYLHVLEDSFQLRSEWHEEPSDEIKFLQFLEDSFRQRSEWHEGPLGYFEDGNDFAAFWAFQGWL